MWVRLVVKQKARKAIDNVRVNLNKIHVNGVNNCIVSSHFNLVFNHFGSFNVVNNK